MTLTATYGGDAFFNGSVTTSSVTVLVYYTFIGFLTPLTTAGTLSSPSNSGTGNFTQGVPIKWQLKDSTGAYITSLSSTQTLAAIYYTGGVCTGGQATGTVFVLYSPTSGATGGSTFRYDSTNNQFIFNMATGSLTTGAGCYEIELTLSDGSPIKATTLKLQ